MDHYQEFGRAFEGLIEKSSVIGSIKSDIGELKTDVAELKADVAELKADVAELKADNKIFRKMAVTVENLAQQFLAFQDGMSLLLEERKRNVKTTETVEKIENEAIGVQMALKNHVQDKTVHLTPSSR